MLHSILLAADVITSGSLISLLIWLVITAVIVWLIFYILGMMPLDARLKSIITVVAAIILLLVVLNKLGWL